MFGAADFRRHADVSPAGLTVILVGGSGLGLISVAALGTHHGALILAAVCVALGAVIIGRLREVLLAIAILDVGLGLDINLLYREDLAKLGTLGGFNFSATSFAIATLYLLWLAEYVCAKQNRSPARLRVALPLLVYAAAVWLSALFTASDRQLAFFQLFLLVQSILLYVYIASRVRSREQLLFVVALLLASLALQGVFMLITRLAGVPLQIGPVTTQVDAAGGLLRVGGTVGSPNNSAAFCGMLLPLGVALTFTRVAKIHRLLALAALVLGGLGLLVTFSRGGWAAFAVSMSVMGYLLWKREWLDGRTAAIVAGTTLVLLAVFQSTVMERLFGSDGGAAYSRLPLMQLAFSMIAQHPFLGVGANNFAFSMHDYVTPQLRNEWLYTTHNRYLVVWAETGLIGLVGFVWFLAATLRASWRLSLLADARIAPWIMGLSAAVLGHLVHMSVEIFNGRPLLQLSCIIAGLISAAATLYKVK